MNESTVVFTIGHSTRTLEVFTGLLKMNGVNTVADIRTIPRSRHNPQFNKETLPAALSASGIGYQHMAGLGGLRRPQPDSANTGWRNASFRGFADYMQTAEFEENLSLLTDLAKRETVCLMCAEAVPWRCHRSLISDALVVRGSKVLHILSAASNREHVLTPWLRTADGHLVYPPQPAQ